MGTPFQFRGIGPDLHDSASSPISTPVRPTFNSTSPQNGLTELINGWVLLSSSDENELPWLLQKAVGATETGWGQDIAQLGETHT